MDFTRIRRQVSASSSKLLECQRAQLVRVFFGGELRVVRAIKHIVVADMLARVSRPTAISARTQST